MTAHGDVEMAVEAVRNRGAFWFFQKPVDTNMLELQVRQALEHANGRPEQARTLERLAEARSVAAPAEAAEYRERAADLRRTFTIAVPPVDR